MDHFRAAVFCHGFNVGDGGTGSVDKLKPYFKNLGYDIYDFDYHWVFLLGVRFFNSFFAKRMVQLTKNLRQNLYTEIVICGHSNGCAISWRAAKMGAYIDKLVLINPALNNDVDFPKQIKKIHVWFSPSDPYVKLARWLIFHTWGNCGSTGWKGKPDSRVTNFNKEEDFEVISKTHSDVFSDEKIKYFGPIIAQKITEDN